MAEKKCLLDTRSGLVVSFPEIDHQALQHHKSLQYDAEPETLPIR